jgi:hypothetical protein
VNSDNLTLQQTQNSNVVRTSFIITLDARNSQKMSDTNKEIDHQKPVTATYNRVEDSGEGKIKHQLKFSFKYVQISNLRFYLQFRFDHEESLQKTFENVDSINTNEEQIKHDPLFKTLNYELERQIHNSKSLSVTNRSL